MARPEGLVVGVRSLWQGAREYHLGSKLVSSVLSGILWHSLALSYIMYSLWLSLALFGSHLISCILSLALSFVVGVRSLWQGGRKDHLGSHEISSILSGPLWLSSHIMHSLWLSLALPGSLWLSLWLWVGSLWQGGRKYHLI